MPSPPARPPFLARSARYVALAVVTATVGLAPAACAHHAKPDPNAAPEPEVGPTTVRVQNQSFADVTVYVYRSSSRARLGFVTGNSTGVLTIPKTFVSTMTQLRFLAVPVGGRRQPISEEITVSPGDEIGIVVPPN